MKILIFFQILKTPNPKTFFLAADFFDSFHFLLYSTDLKKTVFLCFFEATGEARVTANQQADLQTAVTFFNKDPTIDWSSTDMKVEYETFVERVSNIAELYPTWKYDKDERGRDHKRKGEWIPLKIVEHLKNPQTGMAQGIPQLSRLAGIAGLLNPSSCCTERLVKEHKCVTFVNTTMGEHMVLCTLAFLCNTTFPLVNETYCEGQVYMRVQRARRRGRCARPLAPTLPQRWLAHARRVSLMMVLCSDE